MYDLIILISSNPLFRNFVLGFIGSDTIGTGSMVKVIALFF